ncbi:N-acetylglucosamine kinase-like BadF-type ATPase [Haloactinopolyspora alba]|uniref:N-acetylglucosamine kinase-like BadF-type ATPase n=1 Tax=Haloactinopolyspora alba TaxID=648780 RepID=A0A2P8DY64_9ACTN|nr:BadF/BadG/BcrA/BcrD ATPase family protein [Haloactinopolyspora alba]PSL02166.1 N-acetylglucosamine kinase-like BadF-type ATPase [Haloactinopolyspora alba]
MTPPPARLVLGLDIGGTSTRALVVGTDGVRHGSGRGPGANITSHSLDHAMDAVSVTLDEALRGVDSSAVVAGVIGAAGDRNLIVPDTAEALTKRWRAAGLTCEYTVTSDALVAYVAGTSARDGSLLLSGTGALVARAEQRQLTRIVDGHGWLLGDLGSGFWLGREAVRSTLAFLDRGVSPGPLGQAVLAFQLGGAGTWPPDRVTVAELVLKVHDRPPVALSELAPLVTRHADDDPEAGRILREAAAHLMRATDTVRAPGETTPVVLTGSLLASDTPLARLVRGELAERWPDATVTTATDATAGAAWLAAVHADGLDDAAADALHVRLFSSHDRARHE